MTWSPGARRGWPGRTCLASPSARPRWAIRSARRAGARRRRNSPGAPRPCAAAAAGWGSARAVLPSDRTGCGRLAGRLPPPDLVGRNEAVIAQAVVEGIGVVRVRLEGCPGLLSPAGLDQRVRVDEIRGRRDIIESAHHPVAESVLGQRAGSEPGPSRIAPKSKHQHPRRAASCSSSSTIPQPIGHCERETVEIRDRRSCSSTIGEIRHRVVRL